MKKKWLALMMASLSVSLPMTQVVSSYNVGDNNYIIASAVDSTLKYGDTLTFSKTDYNIQPLSMDRATMLNNGVLKPLIDELWVYCTQLDRDGNPTLIGYLDSTSTADEITTTYNPQYLYYTVSHRNCMYYAVGNHNVLGGSLEIKALKPDGEWKVVDNSPLGGGAHGEVIQIPRFTEEYFKSVYKYIPDDASFSVYKKDSSGEFKLHETILKGSDTSNMVFLDTSYEDYYWEVPIDYTITNERSVKHYYGTVKGSWVSDMPYVYGRDIKCDTEILETPTAEENVDTKNNPIIDLEYPETDKNGNIIYDEDNKPIMNSLYDREHGDATVIKNTEAVQFISAGDLDKAMPLLEDYDADATYFLKVGTDSNNNEFIYYRYDNKTGTWKFRVDTSNNPTYDVTVDVVNFPKEATSGVMYNKKSSNDSYDGNECGTWTTEDFYTTGKDFTILTNSNNFTYIAFFDYDKNGGAYYEYVGIDPVLIYTYGNRKSYESGKDFGDTFVDREGVDGVKTNAKAGDKIVIDGTEPDGSNVHYEVVQEFDNDTVPVGKGDYTVINETKGIKGEVIKGEPIPSEDGVLNLINSVAESKFKVSDMFDEVISDGNLKGKIPVTLKNLVTDAGMTAKQADYLKLEAYLKFETQSGISNSTDPDDYVKEAGYFVMDTSKNAKTGDIIRIDVTGIKGDVNQDGKFDISDLVFEQKYILGSMSKGETFGLANLIASDLCIDGTSDVFDYIELRKLFVEETNDIK